MSIKTPSSAEEFDKIIAEAGDKKVVVDFFATWCGPCKAIAPKLAELAEQYKDTVIVVKVDVDELDSVAAKAGVKAMPTFILYQNGSKKTEVVGANQQKLESLFKD